MSHRSSLSRVAGIRYRATLHNLDPQHAVTVALDVDSASGTLESPVELHCLSGAHGSTVLQPSTRAAVVPPGTAVTCTFELPEGMAASNSVATPLRVSAVAVDGQLLDEVLVEDEDPWPPPGQPTTTARHILQGKARSPIQVCSHDWLVHAMA